MLNRLNPLTVLALCLGWIVATTFVHTMPFQLFALSLFAGMLLVFRRIGPWRLLLATVPFALFGFGFLTTHVLFRQTDMSGVAVFSQQLAAEDGLRAGLVLFLRAVSGGMISLFFALAVDPGRLVRALMAYCRLPASIAYALFAAMQIVPDLAGKANEMRMAAAMRAGRRPRRFPMPREIANLLIPLLTYAIRRAGRSAIAMEARGFSATRARTILDVPRFSRTDAAFLGLNALLAGISTMLPA